MFKKVFAFAGANALLIAVATTASAHVTVNPSEATQGSFTELMFRVPNEEADAQTVKLEVSFPADNPIAFVSVKPVPGWDYKVEKSKLDKPIESDDGSVNEAVSKITWTAQDGNGVKPGEYQSFPVSVGPLPDSTSLTFPTIQTYSNGTEVKWNETSTPGSDEPEHPAPQLTLTADNSTTSTTVAADSTDDDSDSNKTLSIAALGLAAVALVVAITAKRRR